jgi:vitamin B12 transporter
VHGAEFILGGHLARDLAARFSFTAISSRTAGTDLQRQETPTTLAKLSLDYASSDGPLFVGLTASHTGDVYRSAAGARRNYGNYLVLDLNAGLRLGEKRNHRISFRLENALDEQYASRVRSGTTDAGDSYAFSFLGTPRTLHAAYSYQF